MQRQAVLDASDGVETTDGSRVWGSRSSSPRRDKSLLRLAFVLTSDRHLAEDLTRTTLADAYRNWRKVAAAQDPSAYVRRMLVTRT